MTVLLTGASGFIGSALAAALLDRGERVIGVDRTSMPDAPSDAAYRFVQADLARPGGLDEILVGERVDAVILAAAITADVARERRDPAGVVAVNVGAVADAVRAAATHGVRRVLLLGSGAVYGDEAFAATVLDEAKTRPAPRSLYALTKLSGEDIALRLAETFDIDLTAIRLGTCFGPFERETGARDTPSAPFQILRLAGKDTPVRLPRAARRDWLYVRDAVAGILALLDAPNRRHRVYNVAAGFEWSLADFCARLAQERPGFAWAIAGPQGGNVDLYDPGDRAPISIARLMTDTSYRPRYDLPAALDDLLAWPGSTRPAEVP
ncbi:NAD-dependent epimerase/dehydratase family protein [Methylobacterium sp.]|uniref:NAD-dependent epimerase/dehydratase family protein n=1 Tax=Methylobacterium sp. TaxID=409 RepID=UPI003B00045D